MSDQEKASIVLRLASQTCSAALKALRSPDLTTETTESLSEANLDTILNDFGCLLSLLHQDATKLTIALKPSNSAYSAAITPAKELATHANALASCSCSIRQEKHGHTLVREVRWLAEDVLGALESLLGVYTSDRHREREGDSGTAGDQYLVRTGVLHEAIDRARMTSRTNREAVKKRWDGILGGLDDCEKEVQEMLEEEEGTEGEDRNEGDSMGTEPDSDIRRFDVSGWEELVGGSITTGTKSFASKDELARLKNAQILLKLIHALVSRMDLVLLRSSSCITSPPPGTLDEILSIAGTLLETADDLVHALYIPQDSCAVSIGVKDLVGLVDNLRSELSSVGLVTQERMGRGDDDAVVDLSQRTASMILEDESTKFREKKWFDTCIAQIAKSAERLV